MRTVVAWTVGVWTLVQLAMLSVKFWVRMDLHWAVVLAPTEAAGAVLAATGAVGVWMLWSFARAWDDKEDCNGDR